MRGSICSGSSSSTHALSWTPCEMALGWTASILFLLGVGCSDSRSTAQFERAEKLQQQVEQLTQQTTVLQHKVQVLERQQQSELASVDSMAALDGNRQNTVNKVADVSPKLGLLSNSQVSQDHLLQSKEKWITRIPTHANDGSPIPPDKLTKIVRRVAGEFGGASLDGPGRGIWIGSDGTVFDETSYTLSVACAASEIPQAREMVNWIGCELGQQTMYFEIQNSPVEVIPVKQ